MSPYRTNAFPLVPISQFCETGSGGTPSRSKEALYFGGTIPWVKSGELRENIITSTDESLTEQGLFDSSAKLLPPQTLLVALYGATVGRIGILGIQAATNQAICHVIPNQSRADRNYLFYALQQQVPQWLRKRVGGGQPNISQSVIRETLIPLPALEEQQRIAAILDKADAIRRKREQGIDLTEELIRSVFLDMFGAPVGHASKPLSEVADVVSGVAKGRKLNGRAIVVPYLRVANVQDGYLSLDEIKTIEALPEEVESLALCPGDIVMTEGGDYDKLGRGAIWNHDLTPCIHQNHIFRVRLRKDRILPEFFAAFLRTREAKGYFLRCAKKTTNLASINMTQLKGLPVPLPSMDAQTVFQKAVHTVSEASERRLQARVEADDLFSSLVQRAFRGEL